MQAGFQAAFEFLQGYKSFYSISSELAVSKTHKLFHLVKLHILKMYIYEAKSEKIKP